MTIKEVMACATEDYIRVRLDWIEYEMRNVSNMTAYEQASAKHKCRKWSREIKDYIDKEVR